MKIRNGFVSNSSSSSFLIMSKNGELSSKKLLEIFDVKETSPIYSVVKKLSSEIIECTEKMTHDEFLENYAYGDTLKEKEEELKSDYPEYYEHYKNARKNGWVIYSGSADDYEYSNVASLELKHDDDDIMIEMTGEY